MPRPPRGYNQEEYPLPHYWEMQFGMGLTTSTKPITTIIPLLRHSELAINPSIIPVNPNYPTFAEDTGVTCQPGSIIPRINFTMNVKMSQPQYALDTIQNIMFWWQPIYMAYKRRYDAEDDESGLDVGELIEMEYETTNKSAQPIYNGTDVFSAGNIPLSTIDDANEDGVTDWGLTTDDKLEGITLDTTVLHEHLRNATNKEMIKQVLGKRHYVNIKPRKDYLYHSNNATNSTVKRMNPYTFCGIIIHVPINTSIEQNIRTISNIEHLNFTIRSSFDEWNPNFMQVAS